MKTKILFLVAALSCALMSVAQDVYVLDAHSQLRPAMRAVTGGIKVKGNALLVAYGGKLKSAMQLEGKSADLTLPLGATYFYLRVPKNVNVRTWKMSPVEAKKKNRELVYSKTGAYSGSSSAIDEIELQVEQLSDDIYFVKPTETLLKGEYVLFRMEMGTPVDIYDFRVDPSLSSALQIPSAEQVMADMNSGGNAGRVYGGTYQYGTTAETSSKPVASIPTTSRPAETKPTSDVDIDIPKGKKGSAENTFVVIIANENYQEVEKVPYTINDGEIFAEYCKKTLGIPESNISLVKDATANNMKREVRWLTRILHEYDGEGKAIIYYAGHGIPNESTRDAYLLPVDGYGDDPTTGYSLNELYAALNEAPSKQTLVFLDACFSGANRDGGMIVSARGVAIKAKPTMPVGNMIVFSAAQGDETAYPYEGKGHGLFTYYFLKKLKESKGNVTLGELSDYVTDQVGKQSIIINRKSQTPNVSVSASMKEDWKKLKLK